MGSESATRRRQRVQHAPGKTHLRTRKSALTNRTECASIHRKCIYQDDPNRLIFQAPVDATRPVADKAAHEDHVALLLDSQIHADLEARIGGREQLHATVGNYFATVHQRVTIINKKRFLDRLVSFNTIPADFAALCLAMHLVIRQPSTPSASMLSQTYGSLKSLIGLLEASEYLSLDVVQCRILCATYEFGHGILAAASMSVAACARVARFIGIQPRQRGATPGKSDTPEDEERSRAWWALANLERYNVL